METWNRAVFLALNTPEHPNSGVVLLAIAIAQGAIFLVPPLLASLWLWGGRGDRSGLLLAFCGAEAALGFNKLAAAVWYHPRPFAVPIGRTLVEHVADSSFPSAPLTFLVAVLVWTAPFGIVVPD
ncbi:hypothetical protein [Lichenifustis flavocetrariae]|uniref:Uncharacterized protein n=1 Tax=Lichenifustis flavocetrariae TaxID=2949735 RepID=A0AA42CND3_9HYPH|nr:hypothetical protein [Lichenifustis flavocetrariae]MCW6512646.1 hypothetical protein [Lichenifustis flavocetrariae]